MQPADPTKPVMQTPDRPTQPGEAVTLTAPEHPELDALDAQLDALSDATADSVLRERAIPFATELGYDPRAAKNLDKIQASGLALQERDLEKLAQQGFAISTARAFPNMAYGLRSIYAEHLPVYISLDPILEAVHDSYDAILKAVEQSLLVGDLTTVLNVARARNAASAAPAQVRADLDFYLGVALSLLIDQAVQPVAGADAAAIRSFYTKAVAADGGDENELFGFKRLIDYSQFKPRGHYADSLELTRYFRATMWLGRIDFRLIETLPNGDRVFHRRQFDAVLALRDLVRDDGQRAFDRIDAVVSAFVGEHDYMRLAQIDALLTDLGASSVADVAPLSSQQIAQTILDHGYGAQRIASQLIYKQSDAPATLSLDRSFALLGQRYIVDSHVFSNVVYDRVNPGPGEERRFLPDPLDAAYAVLGNAAALPLLSDDLELHGYAPALERMRQLVDAHGAEFWQQNLYNLWLSSLRAMSPTAAELAQLPRVAQTERWSRRVLQTQLASWAELRHDTILYAKQSYTAGPACEFPDAYVDPYPEAFARLAAFAARGKQLGTLLGQDASSELVSAIEKYFDELASVSNILRDMAEQQRKGVPFNAAQMAFVNDAVKSSTGACGGPTPYLGWYARLLYTHDDGQMKPTIADVHTDPGGDHPAHVLHVATGLPHFMVLTVDTCQGPQAYAGVSFSYHEVVTEGLTRLNDQDWAKMAGAAAPPRWLEPVLP